MEMIEFIPESLFILVVATNILGVFLKKVECIKDNFIPIILLGFAILFSMALEGASPTSFLQGIITWGVAVGLHQTVHQISKDQNNI